MKPYTLTKTEAAAIEAIRKLPTFCRGRAAQSLTGLVVALHSGLVAGGLREPPAVSDKSVQGGA